MHTDILFYKLFETQPHLVMHLAGLEQLRDVPYRLQSVELKEKAQRTDAVLFPEPGAPADAPIIVCEVQFWQDARIYNRLVSETALLSFQHPAEQRFQMVLILPNRAADTDAGVWQLLKDGGAIEVVYVEEALASITSEQSAEERTAMLLMQLTVTPVNRAADDALLPTIRQTIAATRNEGLQRLFRDLFVSLYASKYKNISLEEIRAMIDTREIFDDIGESLAVQQYAQQYAQKAKMEGKLESAIAMVGLGISVEQTASALGLSVSAVEEALAKNVS